MALMVNPDEEPFETRPLEGAPNPSSTCNLHLLDGQQRLTALWRSMNDNYEDRTFFVRFKKNDKDYSFDEVISEARKGRNSSWIGNSIAELQKNYFPIRLLLPESGRKRREWAREATNNDYEGQEALLDVIDHIADRLSSKCLPCFELSIGTEAEDAIDYFIRINTSFVKLTAYDIAVAQFEAATSESLRDMVNSLKDKVPYLTCLVEEDDVGDTMLKIACLMQGKKPTFGNYKNLDFGQLKKEQNTLFSGVKWAVDFIKNEGVLDKKRLPSTVPLRVLPALYQYIPRKGDEGLVDSLIRQYLWRAFSTDWYEKQANSRLYDDFKALKKAITNGSFEVSKTKKKVEETVFDSCLPEYDELKNEKWPTGQGIKKRAILAIYLKEGAKDIASSVKISYQNIGKREYHHVFPKGLFTENPDGHDHDRALNCILIEKFTNISWRDKWPGDYLIERVGKRDENTVRRRLESHLLPVDEVMNAKEEAGVSLSEAYDEFLEARAKLVEGEMKRLCNGE